MSMRYSPWEGTGHLYEGQFDSRYQHTLAVCMFSATSPRGGINTQEIIMIVIKLTTKMSV